MGLENSLHEKATKRRPRGMKISCGHNGVKKDIKIKTVLQYRLFAQNAQKKRIKTDGSYPET